MTVRGYLALLVGVLVIAVGAVTLIGRVLVGDLGDAVREAAGSSGAKVRAAGELRAAYLSEQRDLARFLATADPADASGVARARDGFRRWRAELAGAGLVQSEQAALAEVDRLLAAQQAAADRAIELRRSGRTAEARRVAEREIDPAGPRLEELLAALEAGAANGSLDAGTARAERAAPPPGGGRCCWGCWSPWPRRRWPCG
jgi:hypothetical protein